MGPELGSLRRLTASILYAKALPCSRGLTLSPCPHPQGLLLRQLHHMPQVCSAHLEEAVSFPGAWSRCGCLEPRAPLPGLSRAHPTGHCQSQGDSYALQTPGLQLLDLSPCWARGCKHHTGHPLRALVELRAVPGCFLGRVVRARTCTPTLQGSIGRGVGEGFLPVARTPPPQHTPGTKVAGFLLPWKLWRASGEWLKRPEDAGCTHRALA